MAEFMVKLADGTDESVIANAFTVDGAAIRFTSQDGTTIAFIAAGQAAWIIDKSAFPPAPAP